jgi:hypothetical protein
MLLHLLLVIGFIFSFVLLFMGLVATKKLGIRLTRLLISAVAALSFTALILLYVSDYVSNHIWGDNLSYDVVLQSVFYIGTYLRAVNVRPIWAYLLGMIGCGAIFCGYFKVSASVLLNLNELVSHSRALKPFSDRKHAVTSILVFSVIGLAYVSSVALVFWLIPSPGAAQEEPILSLLTPRFLVQGSNALTSAEQHIRKQYAAPKVFERKTVIVIIADSLRADHMQVYGYQRDTTPFLARLMQEGSLRRIRLAAANCPATRCGIMSILTSRSVERLHPGNLGVYDLLYDQGYKVYLILSGDHGVFPDLKQSYGQNVSSYFDGTNSKRFAPTDDRVLFEGLERIPPHDKTPAFFLFHLMSPHVTGIKLDGYDRYLPCRKEMELMVRRTWDPAEVTNCYDNRILQTDDILRQLFDVLTQKGYLTGSLVIILADHGDGLGEHGVFGHGTDLYEEEISIPMLIYDTGDVSYKNLEYATQVDVAPTILDRLGLPIPSVWEGHSAYGSSGDEYSFHRTWKPPFRVAEIYRTEKALFKYIYWEEDHKEELYELWSDPKENHNLIMTADSTLIIKMREQIARHGITVHGARQKAAQSQ